MMASVVACTINNNVALLLKLADFRQAFARLLVGAASQRMYILG